MVTEITSILQCRKNHGCSHSKKNFKLPWSQNFPGQDLDMICSYFIGIHRNIEALFRMPML